MEDTDPNIAKIAAILSEINTNMNMIFELLSIQEFRPNEDLVAKDVNFIIGRTMYCVHR